MKKVECCGIIPLKKGDDNSWQALILLHKSGLFWGFPKGHKDPEETPLETAKRELKEETGLQVVSLLNSKPYSESFSFYKDDILIYKEVRYYVAEVSGNIRLANEEILEAKWCPLNEVESYLTFDGTRQIAKEVCDNLKSL